LKQHTHTGIVRKNEQMIRRRRLQVVAKSIGIAAEYPRRRASLTAT
jgi:hypothetical protein